MHAVEISFKLNYLSLQISTSGEILDSATSPYILLGKVLARNPAVDIYPHVTMPLCTAPLKHLLSVLQIALRHNFISGLLVVAGSMMALHYSAVVKVNSGCPMVIASGASETGKSTAIKAALSITGNSIPCVCYVASQLKHQSITMGLTCFRCKERHIR